MSKYVLGINSAYHESSACLIKDGRIVAAAEEERFNRKKRGKHPLIDNPHVLPLCSIDYCLKEGGINFDRIDQVGYSFNPIERLVKNLGLEKNVIPGDWGSDKGEELFYKLTLSIPKILEDHYKTDLSKKWNWIPHHVCHASSAFFASSFKEAAILTVDGIGEFESILFGYGNGNSLKLIKLSGSYPNSIGFLWTKASRFLNFTEDGFGEYGAGKIMALAAYGNSSRYYAKFRKFVNYNGVELKIDNKIVQFREEGHEEYEKLFGFKARKSGEELKQKHMDFAATMQKINNEIMFKFAEQLYSATKAKKLCMAGGVALNCNTNAFIFKNGHFEDIYIQPAANDMGTAAGAAYYVYHQILGNKQRFSMETPYLGPEYSEKQVLECLKENKEVIEFKKVKNIEKIVACLLSKGMVVGWFQGRMEFGPRALGNRSLLADPRNPNMKKLLSEEIKKREWFRPLAPTVLEEEADKWFIRPKQGVEADKWMLVAYPIKKEKRKLIPSTVHKDNTGRVQVVNSNINPRMHKLIYEFKKITGVPLILNTSFNIREPIVCDPNHAISTLIKSGSPGINAVAIGDYLVARKGLFFKLDEIINLCLR